MSKMFKWSMVTAFLVIACWALATFPRPAWAAGTPTATPTATASATLPAATRTATATGTSTPLPTRTATATSTSLPVATNTPTATKTNTAVATSAPTVTRTATATVTTQNTPTNTPTITPTPQNSPTATPTTFTFNWWFPTPPWSGVPAGNNPWALNPFNLKQSYNFPLTNPSNSTPVPSAPGTTGNLTPTAPNATGVALPSAPSSEPNAVPTQANSPWLFPNIFPFGEPTRSALAPENAQPQATVDTQTGDLTDTMTASPSEENPANPFYYARRLGTVSILASGILLLASGALGTAAIYFFIRARLRG